MNKKALLGGKNKKSAAATFILDAKNKDEDNKKNNTSSADKNANTKSQETLEPEITKTSSNKGDSTAIEKPKKPKTPAKPKAPAKKKTAATPKADSNRKKVGISIRIDKEVVSYYKEMAQTYNSKTSFFVNSALNYAKNNNMFTAVIKEKNDDFFDMSMLPSNNTDRLSVTIDSELYDFYKKANNSFEKTIETALKNVMNERKQKTEN